jgi:hypothetical protein
VSFRFPLLARIVAFPTLRDVTSPLVVKLATVPMDLGTTDHFTWFVMSRMDPPEKSPVAVICCVPLRGRSTVGGATVIEVSVSFVTVSTVVAETPPSAAVSVVVPGDTAVARPAELIEFETVALVVSEDDQTT